MYRQLVYCMLHVEAKRNEYAVFRFYYFMASIEDNTLNFSDLNLLPLKIIRLAVYIFYHVVTLSVRFFKCVIALASNDQFELRCANW